MSQQPPLFPAYSPGVMSILPLFYVGWADSVLSPSEVKLIKEKINDLHFLTTEDNKLTLKTLPGCGCGSYSTHGVTKTETIS